MTSSAFNDGPLVDAPGHGLDLTLDWAGLGGGSAHIRQLTSELDVGKSIINE